MDEISKDRHRHLLSELPQEKAIVHDIFLKDTKAAYSKMLVAQEKKAAEKKEFSKNSADNSIDYVKDLGKATGAAEVREDFISNLSFSDPIYAEPYIKMHRFDILLVFQGGEQAWKRGDTSPSLLVALSLLMGRNLLVALSLLSLLTALNLLAALSPLSSMMKTTITAVDIMMVTPATTTLESIVKSIGTPPSTNIMGGEGITAVYFVVMYYLDIEPRT
ncbi:hypothetical protein DFH29DRAFT_880515 [Suillus ampliporus]|nr:hypothetical protein DFH29DRAFT_880515 [Suillus ampliporus]